MDGTVVATAHFPQCFYAFITTAGAFYSNSLVLYEHDGTQVTKIKATASFVTMINPTDDESQERMLHDIRKVISDNGPAGSFIQGVSLQLIFRLAS